MQAFRCSLYGVDCESGNWSAEACQQFEDLTLDKSMVAKVISRNKDVVHVISLINVGQDGEPDEVISDTLIAKGVAVTACTPLTSRLLSLESKQPAVAAEKVTIRSPRQTFKDMQLTIGDTHQAIVSWINSPREFFCQLVKSKIDIVRSAQDLFNCYSKLGLNDLTLPQPEVGQLCVAYYTEDGNWYRGADRQTGCQ